MESQQQEQVDLQIVSPPNQQDEQYFLLLGNSKQPLKKKISEEKKKQFIEKILHEKCNIQEAGLFFNINKSSAKRIWQKYRKQHQISDKKQTKQMPKHLLTLCKDFYHQKQFDLPKDFVDDPESTDFLFTSYIKTPLPRPEDIEVQDEVEVEQPAEVKIMKDQQVVENFNSCEAFARTALLFQQQQSQLEKEVE